MKYVLGNHWREAPEGWTVLKEEDQDITKRFKWDDNSVDVLLSEHVIEHCSLEGGINYMEESFRVLKPGGILRTVWPAIEKLVQYKDDGLLTQDYVRTSLKPYYPVETAILARYGINIERHGLPFLFDSLLKKHGHVHVWSSHLMYLILKKIGFREIYVVNPGCSNLDESTCLERIVRGVSDPSVKYFDCESQVIEARK